MHRVIPVSAPQQAHQLSILGQCASPPWASVSLYVNIRSFRPECFLLYDLTRDDLGEITEWGGSFLRTSISLNCALTPLLGGLYLTMQSKLWADATEAGF